MLFSGLILLVIGLAGCSLADAVTPTQAEVISPSQTPFIVKETVVVVITSTSAPATATPASVSATPKPDLPTATAKPSPTSLALLNIPIEGGDPQKMFYVTLVFPDYRPAATKSLWFRVYAHKPFTSKVDGEGIASVDFNIEDSNGDEVYSRQEKTAGYCAFGGGEPDCIIWDLAANQYKWPNGTKILSDTFTMRITVTANDNSIMNGKTEFNVKVP